jgi:hypothetical protein
MKLLADTRNIGVSGKYWRIPKILASNKNIGVPWKYLRLMKILADTQNIGFSWKHWRVYKMLASAGVKISAPSKNISGKVWRPTYFLGSAESPTADFLLDWLKSSCSDPRRCAASQTCRPEVRSQLKPLCFYGQRLSCTVPAGCTGPTCQNIRGCPNSWRPCIFSPIPVKTQKFYLGS